MKNVLTKFAENGEVFSNIGFLFFFGIIAFGVIFD